MSAVGARAGGCPGGVWVCVAIIGAKRRDQLDDNLRAPDVRLTADEPRKLDEVSSLPPGYPGWMLARQSADRLPPET